MNDFLRIKNIYVSEDTLLQTGGWLRQAGTRGNEAFILWAGVFETDEDFIVTTAIYPEQTVLRSSSGIGVHVSGEELFRISRWLYENKKILIAQVHSHPGFAFHSDTDDSFPMVTAIGQFSIVVPNFARAQLTNLKTCAVYRLNNKNLWANVPNSVINEIFVVVDNGAS